MDRETLTRRAQRLAQQLNEHLPRDHRAVVETDEDGACVVVLFHDRPSGIVVDVNPDEYLVSGDDAGTAATLEPSCASAITAVRRWLEGEG